MNRFSQRLNLEPLEERRLLATCHVVRLGDFGAGSDLGGGHSRGDLRYCITKANNEPGADIVLLERSGVINLTSALAELASDMDIVGPGSSLLTVRRNTGGNYRIFDVPAGAIVHISGLTATNGGASIGGGGGIRNLGTLTLVDVKINANDFGGIYNKGTLLISHSAVSNNDTYATGAGIWNDSGGSLTVSYTTIVQNSAGQSEVTSGGGITNYGSALIEYSTISNNSATSYGQIPDAFGGGIYTTGPLTITNSTISGNQLNAYPSGDVEGLTWGGGIYKSSTSLLTIDNSTIANNKVGAEIAAGGGIYISGGTASVTHSTIAGNYEGIWVGGQLTLRNSIVAKNNGLNNTGKDINGTITSSGYNLIGKSAGGSGYVPSDILDVDPKLGPLANNGGPTLTMALLPGSPAIDSGTNQGAPEWDQRGPGFPRIVNATIDRGAFEVQATGAPIPPPSLAFLLTANLENEDVFSEGAHR
jgi:hypothetical protein